jgi:hypothetical protein
MVGVDNGIGLLAVAACHHYHDHNTLMRKLEDDVKKHRVVCLHLNGYNIFVKRCSLERIDGIPFGSILEFINYSLDKKVFEKKRVHRKKSRAAGSDGDGESVLGSFIAETSKAYKNMSRKEKKIYKEIAAYISIPPYRRGDRSYHDLIDKIENLVEVGADTDTNDP